MNNIIIGDDYPFTIQNVRRERDGVLIPDAVVTWELLDSRYVEITSGTAALYDSDTASFEANIARADLEDPDEPDESVLEDKQQYYLNIHVLHNSIRTTKTVVLVASRVALSSH